MIIIVIISELKYLFKCDNIDLKILPSLNTAYLRYVTILVYKPLLGLPNEHLTGTCFSAKFLFVSWSASLKVSITNALLVVILNIKFLRYIKICPRTIFDL
jgi:hypothetical protein